MSVNVRTKYLLLGLVLSLLVAFVGGWYIGHAKEKKASQIAQESLKNEIQKLVVQINDTEYYLTRVEQELATEKELRKQDIFEKKELSALNLKKANEISRLKFRIDTLLEDVGHTGNIIPIDTVFVDNIPHNAIILPFAFDKRDKWLDLKGNFDNQGKLDISLKMDLSVNAVSGIDKTTKKPTLALYTDNKYIETIDVASYKIDVEKPKPWGIGVQAGYGVILGDPIKTAPYVGMGVSRNIIRF